MKNEPPEIVILNDYASPTGGSSAVAIASAAGLAARGLNVTYFSCVGPVAPQLRGRANLRVVCLDQPDIGKHPSRLGAFAQGMCNVRAVHALRGVLADKPRGNTVVHAHTWSQALSPFALSTATGLGFPLVVTLHDFFTACPNGQFFVYPKGEICTRAPLSAACWACRCDRRNHAHKLWRNLRAAVQGGLLRLPRKASYFIGVSEFSLKVLRPHLPAHTPVRVIRNPVDCPPSAPAPVEANREFVFIGRFEAEKGALLFAQAVQATGVSATFVGDGSLLPSLKALCPQSRFTGWLPPEQIRARLRMARALVFPSLWHETLGMVVIEAAAAGVPAIVSDRCAATDHVVHGCNGLRFAHGSARALGEAMVRLASDGAFAARLGRAAHAGHWSAPWTVGRHVDELLEIYKTLAAPAPAAAKTGDVYESAHGFGARG